MGLVDCCFAYFVAVSVIFAQRIEAQQAGGIVYVTPTGALTKIKVDFV